MTSQHCPDSLGSRAAEPDEADIEEVLRAEARVVDDMVLTHDTDDFMRRLAHRIADQAEQSPRVGRAASENPVERSEETAPTAPPTTARHDAVRPRGRRARRRRPTPVVQRDLMADPRATRAYLLDVCETVLCDVQEDEFDLYECDGARAFACMLYLLGRRTSAIFWWGFAAGADDALAAHLLATHYSIDDACLNKARAWRWYARLLGYRGRRHLPHLIQDSQRLKEQVAAELATSYPWPQIMRTFIDTPPV